MMVEVSLATGGSQSHCPGAALVPVSHLVLVTARLYGQCSGCCYGSLLCDGAITSTALARCLGPSRPARKEELAWCPGTLRPVGRGRRNLFGLSTWCTGPSRPDNEGKGTSV